jgi:hypothetical protein
MAQAPQRVVSAAWQVQEAGGRIQETEPPHPAANFRPRVRQQILAQKTAASTPAPAAAPPNTSGFGNEEGHNHRY